MRVAAAPPVLIEQTGRIHEEEIMIFMVIYRKTLGVEEWQRMSGKIASKKDLKLGTE